jgi:hypothetical protein
MKTALALASLLLLPGCGTQTGSASVGVTPAADPMPTTIPAASGTVSSGLATVMDPGRPELCLGAVAESYPPQCSGIPLKGWDWDDHADLYDRSGDIKWGSFAVTGRFDGTTFTVTGAVPSAVYDPGAEGPVAFPTAQHSTADSSRIMDELNDLPGMLTSDSQLDRVEVSVVYDDGSLQSWADATYGEGLVRVHSALAPTAH